VIIAQIEAICHITEGPCLCFGHLYNVLTLMSE
jgi:hypothetical protein